MKIKVIYPNERGKLEFTKEELEKLLEESYQDGVNDGKKMPTFSYIPTYNSTADSTITLTADGVYPSCVTDVAYANCTLTGAVTNDKG